MVTTHPLTDISNEYSDFPEDKLTKYAQAYGKLLGQLRDQGYSSTERCNGSTNAVNFKKYTQEMSLIETVQRRRIELEEIHPIYHDDPADVTPSSFPIPDPLPSPLVTITITSDNPSQDATKPLDISPPPPLSQLPPLPSCFPITITTSPPDIIAPQPFLPSPNISSQLSQTHIHPPHHHHLPDIVTPPPLPLKPNIVPIQFTFV